MSTLLLAMIASLSACGGGGGGGDGHEETVTRPVTDTPQAPGVPNDGTQVPPIADGSTNPPDDKPVDDTPPAQGGDDNQNPGPQPDPGPIPEDDPPPPPPLETVCAQALDKCIDLNAATVARYLGGKTAAASYTFDDGYVTSTKIAEIFEDFGWRTTFYIIPDKVDMFTGWDYWKPIAARGHEIGNHSMTHDIELNDPTLSEQTLLREIAGGQKAIEDKLGIRPQTMAFPWHLYSSKALEIALRSHFSVRKLDIGESNYEFAFFDTDHEPTLERTLATANAQLTRVVNENGWMVAGGHGVDGDGWSPVTSQFLKDHLTHARQYAPRLWVDTYANVARYRACRDQVAPAVYTSAPGKAVVTLGGNYNASLCDAPLTVSIPVKIALNAGYKVTDQSGQEVDAKIRNGQLLFDLKPGDEAIVEVAITPAKPVKLFR